MTSTCFACTKKSDTADKPPGPAPGSAAKLSAKPVEPVEPKWYRCEVWNPKNSSIRVPFFAQIPEGASGQAVVDTGAEMANVTHRWRGDELVLVFPLYHTEIQAKRGRTGALSGQYIGDSGSSLEFWAQPVEAPTADAFFAIKAEDPQRFVGVWSLATKDHGQAKLSIERLSPDQVRATFMLESGMLATHRGVVSGDTLRMAFFDGKNMGVWTATLSGTAIEGSWTYTETLEEGGEFRGTKVDVFDLKAGPTIAGNDQFSIPQVDLAPYRGKPLVLEMGASWCISCRRSAEALKTLYEELKDRDLQMLTVLYEFSNDEGYLREQAELFKKVHGLPWKVFAVRGEAEDMPNVVPPNLENMDLSGLPYVIFIDREGRARRVEVGFPMVEDKDRYQSTMDRLRAAALTIVE